MSLLLVLCGNLATLATEHASIKTGRQSQKNQPAAALAAWFATAPGTDLLNRETELIQQHVRRFHGDTLLWLGPVAAASGVTFCLRAGSIRFGWRIPVFRERAPVTNPPLTERQSNDGSDQG